MKGLLRAPGRPTSVLLIAVLAGPTIAWCRYVVDALAGCAGGYGNHRVSGDVTPAGCLLSVSGEPVYRLPWLADFVAAASLLVALLAVVVVLCWPLRSAVRPVLALLPLPLLLSAVVLMRYKSWGPPGKAHMTSGFLAHVAVRPQTAGSDAPARAVEVADAGWRVVMPGAGILVPAPGLIWYLVACFGVLLAALVVVVVWRARPRRAPAGDTRRRSPRAAGSPR
ncbi:hypothetical protein GCM10009854_25420 [Saccharopolyspora halophila]|uniref:Uncharacterized protein n=1 Tax=Saccharopolyspora halophila TaxID=405551 RepID=A0ABN3GB31_9PSEU